MYEYLLDVRDLFKKYHPSVSNQDIYLHYDSYSCLHSNGQSSFGNMSRHRFRPSAQSHVAWRLTPVLQQLAFCAFSVVKVGPLWWHLNVRKKCAGSLITRSGCKPHYLITLSTHSLTKNEGPMVLEQISYMIVDVNVRMTIDYL